MRGTAGEGSEFDESFDSIFLLAFTVGRRILQDRDEAQDIASETAARALLQWKRIGGAQHLEPWVKRVATNLSLDVVRKRQRSRTFSQPDISQTSLELADPDAAAELLAGLPRRQREVLALRYVLDLSEEEIAAALRISPGSVKQHASRGLAALRSKVPHPSSEINVAY